MHAPMDTTAMVMIVIGVRLAYHLDGKRSERLISFPKNGVSGVADVWTDRDVHR